MGQVVTVKKAKTPVTNIATGALGAMASKTVAPFIPGGAYGKVALAVGFGVLAAIIPNKNGKAAAMGAGIIQLTEAASEIAAPVVSKWADSGETNKLKELVKKTVGLAAPDTSYIEELIALDRQLAPVYPDASAPVSPDASAAIETDTALGA